MRALIENARLIGLVSPRMAELAREVEGEGVVNGPLEGEESGGGDIPERFQRKKKYRTASISGECASQATIGLYPHHWPLPLAPPTDSSLGLVQSLSNHFRSMGGGGHSSPPHPPAAPPMEEPQEVGGASVPVARHSRRLSFKRRAGSDEDLLRLSKR